MADQQQPPPNQLAAVLPGPPLFWKQFTPDSIERIEKLRAENSADQKVADNSFYKLPPRILDLPAELRYLQPPEPPVSGNYRTFGHAYKIKDDPPTLEGSGVEQLYTPPDTPTGTGKHGDRALILKRIAKSLLLNFLELTGIMSIHPEQCGEKISDLYTLFINFHHLLNEYRPHQARESLILMMQEQLEKSRAETEGIMKMKEKVEEILEGFGRIKLADEVIASSQLHEDVMEDDGKDVWKQLDLEFG
ncbi:Mediator of RNA polymerase II transcription subunit 7 [Ciborinia camelliae]|nr:Mediator of RNA polymerase II transcription subunit 7 [Ciborinia camelliae]